MLSTSAALSRQGFVRCPGFAKLFQSKTSFRRLDYVAHVELVCNACDLLKYGNKWEIMRVFVSTTILCTCPTFATPDKGSLQNKFSVKVGIFAQGGGGGV